MDTKTFELQIIKDLNKSYSEFKEQQSKMLFEITKKAQQTPIYKRKVKIIGDVEKLNELPLTFYEHIDSAIKKYGLEACLLKPYRIEAQTAGSTGVPKKFYYGGEDINRFLNLGGKVIYLLGLKRGDVLWGLGAPYPYISGFLFSEVLNKIGYVTITTYITKPQDLVKGLRKISKIRVDVTGIVGSPGVLLAIAQIASDPKIFKKQVRKKMGKLGELFSSLYLRGINFEKINEIIKNVKVVISGGEPLKPYRKNLTTFYTHAKIFEVYGSTELTLGMLQLSENSYLNPLLDWFIPEIAKPEDIRRAKEDPEYVVEAIPWWKWHSGLKGELIITRNGECLPLIRYPTGDIIEVVNSKKSIPIKLNNELYHVALPEVKVLGRSVEVLPPDASEDEMLIFSVARVYVNELKARLNEIKELKMKHFDLYVYRPTPTRQHPKWKLKIIPKEKILDKEKMQNKVREKIVKETELHQTLETLSLAYPKEYVEELFKVEITEPEEYEKVEEEINKKISEGKPLGQIKPCHVHFVKE